MDLLKTIVHTRVIQKIILDEYCFNGVVDVKLLKSGANDVYSITSNSNNRFIFKIFPFSKSINHIDFEIEYIDFLEKNNTLSCGIIKTKDKRNVVEITYSEGVRFAFLTCHMEGDDLNYADAKDAYYYGKNVAKLHKISQEFKPASLIKHNNISLMLDISRLTVEKFLSKYHSNNLYFFVNFVNFLVENISLFNLEEGYCHNDLHGGNAKILHHKVSFFDFDFCGYGPIIYELSVFRWRCMVAKNNDDWLNFLNGYETILNVSDNDLNKILYFVAIRDIFIMSNYIDRVDVIGHEVVNELYINKRMFFLRNIERRIRGVLI